MLDNFLLFALLFRKRRTKKQKSRFLESLTETMTTLGFITAIQQFKINFKTGFNFLAGDLDQAEIIYIVDYNTEELILNKGYKYYLLDPAKNLKTLKNNLLIYLLFSLFLAGFALWALQLSFNYQGVLQRLFIALTILLGFLTILLARGITSRFNFRKSSALFMMCDLAGELKGKKRCFVFADLSLFTGLGRLEFYTKNNLQGKKIVFIENCCSSEKIVCTYSSAKAKSLLDSLTGSDRIDLTVEKTDKTSTDGQFDYFMVSQYDGREDDSPYLTEFCTKNDIEYNEDAYLKMKSFLLEFDKRIEKF